jgi:hypothetical protein
MIPAAPNHHILERAIASIFLGESGFDSPVARSRKPMLCMNHRSLEFQHSGAAILRSSSRRNIPALARGVIAMAANLALETCS